MKRILLITSANTGAGHQSISDSLMEQFSAMPETEVQAMDGFELPGWIGIHGSKIYNFMLRHTPGIFNAAWKLTMAYPPRLTVLSHLCDRRFMETIRTFHPDLILTVHSLFNSVVTQILKRHSLNIPVVVLQADLVDIHSTWCNPDAYMTICPTREAYDASVRQGMHPEKLKIMSFPIRSRFCNAARQADRNEFDASRPLRCLLMSGSEGSGALEAYAEAILVNTDAELTIVCGHNRKLHDTLQKSLDVKYGKRAAVLGFVPDIEQEMLRSDLLIARGSPNTLLEAVTMGLPVAVFGPVPEQERGNARLMTDHNLGVVCESPADAPKVIRSLTSDNAARLKEIRASQHAFRNADNARDIALYVTELAEPLEYTL